MKVLFDVSALLPQHLTPEGLYTKNLYRALRGLGVEVVPVYKNTYGIKQNFIENHLGHTPKKFRSFFASKGAILHAPSGDFLSESPKFKKVLSILDMGMFRDGLYDSKIAKNLQTIIKQQIQNDPLAIFVPTQEVHNEVLVRFPKMVNRVHVVSPGADHITENSRTEENRISEAPYFIFVGTIDKKNNVSGLIKAFAAFCSMQEKVQLIIAGDNGHGHEAIHKLAKSSGVSDRIQFVGYKTIGQLKSIYTGAIALVAPSLYEGFNFPVVEAMTMGCPVLTSGTASLAEVARDGALLVNPKDPENIMAGLERLYVDKIYREKNVEKAKEVISKMTWINCAKQVAKVYATL